MIAAVNHTMNDLISRELYTVADFIQDSTTEIGKSWSFLTHEGKRYVLKVEVLPELDAFAPPMDF